MARHLKPGALPSALAGAAAAMGLLFTSAAGAATRAPVGVPSAAPAKTSHSGAALRSPAAPAGVSINRPTMSMSAYRAATANRVRAGATRPGVARTTAPRTVTSTFGFNGLTQPQCGCAPSDSNGAVLGGNIIEDVNSSLATYNKSGTQLSNRTLATVTGYTTTGLFDPRAIADNTWK